MTAAAAVEPTELEELMKAQAEAAHEREVGDATRPTAEDLAAFASAWAWCSSAPTRFP